MEKEVDAVSKQSSSKEEVAKLNETLGQQFVVENLSGGEPPVRLYDTSGPYTDPEAEIDLHQGLPQLRRDWIESRGPYAESFPRRASL